MFELAPLDYVMLANGVKVDDVPDNSTGYIRLIIRHPMLGSNWQDHGYPAALIEWDHTARYSIVALTDLVEV